MLQNCAYSSFPVTLSISIFLTAINKEKLEKTTGLKILQTGVGEVSGLGVFYTPKNILIVFLRNPGAHEHLWATSVIVLRAFLWSSCICQNTICCTNSTISHREKNTILIRKVQLALRNAGFCFVVSQEQNLQRWAQPLKLSYYSPWFWRSAISSRSMKV